MTPDRNYNYETIPERTLEALDRYLMAGIRPGGFLSCALSNDLCGAIAAADFENTRSIVALAYYLMNAVPYVAQGSTERFERWFTLTAEQRSILTGDCDHIAHIEGRRAVVARAMKTDADDESLENLEAAAAILSNLIAQTIAETPIESHNPDAPPSDAATATGMYDHDDRD